MDFMFHRLRRQLTQPAARKKKVDLDPSKAILLSKLLSISHFAEEYKGLIAVGLRRFLPFYLPSSFTRLESFFL
jgi:hypothetical protein